MTSVQCLRELMNERLTAAAEEIFRVFQETISEYQKEINRQRVLLDIVWKPHIKLHRTELQQQHVCKEEEVLTDQQLCDQERNSSLDQEDPEPPQMKEEQEVCTSLEGERLMLKEETETFMLTHTCVESEDQTQDLSPDETQSESEKEHVVSMSIESSVEPEPTIDDQLFSHNSHVAESQDHKGGKHGDSGSTRKAEPKLEKRHHRKTYLINNEKKEEKKENATKVKNHSNTYTGKKSLNCDTCGKSFRWNTNLITHLRTHTGERPYPCNTCGKRFTDMTTMTRHKRTHTGEKPFPCHHCDKRFSRLGTLNVHMRIHTGEKPYSCNACEKKFSEPGGLRVHLRIHTGEKPYPCNVCEKKFTQPGTLKQHLKIHTGEKPYSCKMCGKVYRLRHHLKIHMRSHASGGDSV